MEHTVDILIPEIGGKIGKLVYEDLTSHGLNVVVFDDSKFTKDIPKYSRELLSYIEIIHPKMIFPIFKGSVIAKLRSQISEDILIPISEHKTIEQLDDKVSACRLCKEIGIPQPYIYSENELEQIKQYPVVFKRSEGLGGSGVYFPKDRTALDKLIKTSRSHLIMDYIDGYDISVDAVRLNGYFHAEAYKIILPKGKGFSFVRKSIRNDKATEIVKQILEKVDYQGICGVDYRVDVKGNIYFLECNPRFSGGLKSSIQSGFDIPYILYKLLIGHDVEPIRYKEGKITYEKKELFSYIKNQLSNLLK